MVQLHLCALVHLLDKFRAFVELLRTKKWYRKGTDL
jgi:hypothetical protein